MYSIRMRASKDETHISGAEKLVNEDMIKNTVLSLLERGLYHEKGCADFLNISVEKIDTVIKNISSLPVILFNVENADKGRHKAKSVLKHIGISEFCIEKAFSLIETENMRGAIIMDMDGNRLEPDKKRGIRASRMDITNKALSEISDALNKYNMLEYKTALSEALVLASKVASIKGSIAELCMSDDPSYIAGYVASKKFGYVRFSHLKKKGDKSGGRVFFVNNIEVSNYITEIEKSAVLIDKFASIKEINDVYNL